MKTLKTFLASGALLGLTVPHGTVLAASLRISPIGAEMLATDRAVTITVANTDGAPVNLQMRLFKWLQAADGAEILDPAKDMLVSPPAITIPAGGSYTLRVVRSSVTPIDRELSYRLLIDELPTPSDPRTPGQGVRLLLRTSLPIFVVDKRAMADLTWSAWQDAAGTHVRVANKGKRRAKISNLILTPERGAPFSFGTDLNGYVLAGATKQFDIAPEAAAQPKLVTGASATITAMGDVGPIRAAVTLSP